MVQSVVSRCILTIPEAVSITVDSATTLCKIGKVSDTLQAHNNLIQLLYTTCITAIQFHHKVASARL
jgi:hypothetical protein